MKEENYVLRWNRSKVYRGFIKQTQREVNALTYRSVLLLSRDLCCMVNSFQWRSVKCSSLPESLLHARCHFAQLIWSSSRQIKVDLLFFPHHRGSEKQHCSCFSEECWFIHIFFCCADYTWYVCASAPCAFTEMGTPPCPRVWLVAVLTSSNLSSDPGSV